MPRLAGLHAAFLLFFSSFPLMAAGQKAVACYRLPLQDPPQWITSGATWDWEKERLLVVDPVDDKIVPYNLLGERGAAVNFPAELRPVKIARASDGFLLELADGSMLSLDRRLAITDRNVAAKSSSALKTSLYQWAATSDGYVAFSAIVDEERRKTNYGFFRAQGDAGLQLLLSADERQKDFFLLGYPYIANSKGEAFFLSMAKHLALYRVNAGPAEKLKGALPSGYATRPDLKTPMTGPRSAPARYAELESLSIPVGLYAQDDYLYLLTRTPAGKGKTAWWLYQIDPSGDGKVLGRVRLPTTAHHLSVIPTPDRGWMLIEKGKVQFDPARRAQTQTVGPMLVVSNAAIRSLSIPQSCSEGGGMFWADQKKSRALFIPETLLASRMILPVDFSSQVHLDIRLAGSPKNLSPCDFLESSMGQGTLPDASRLEELVASSPVAVAGKIVSVEPGWDARLRRVVTKVSLKVSRSLKGSLMVGSQVDFLSPGGSMKVAGKRVCTSPRREFYQPKIGDKVLVSAERSSVNRSLLEIPYVFPLSADDNVQPEPYPALTAEQKPVPLSELLRNSRKTR